MAAFLVRRLIGWTIPSRMKRSGEQEAWTSDAELTCGAAADNHSSTSVRERISKLERQYPFGIMEWGPHE